jgi:exonuclease VII small subunit
MDDQTTYTRLRENLEDIVVQVRSKDVPLEKCLDLFDEALRLGGRCVELIDHTDFSSAELEAAATHESEASADEPDAALENASEAQAATEDDAAPSEVQDHATSPKKARAPHDESSKEVDVEEA